MIKGTLTPVFENPGALGHGLVGLYDGTALGTPYKYVLCVIFAFTIPLFAELNTSRTHLVHICNEVGIEPASSANI